MLITFSGLDGSGKSTLVGGLRAALEARHTPVVVRHMNHDIGAYAAAQALRDRVFGRRRSPDRVRGAAHPPPRSGWRRLRYAILWNKPWRRLVYLADLLLFAVFRLYVERVRRRVLIMDRYFYDTLVDVTGPRSWGWARLLERLTPTPNLAVLLDTSPEVAFARKGEHSVEYLARRSQAYRRVFAWVPSAVVVDNADANRAARDLARMVAREDLR